MQFWKKMLQTAHTSGRDDFTLLSSYVIILLYIIIICFNL